jgi:hypothetical protein
MSVGSGTSVNDRHVIELIAAFAASNGKVGAGIVCQVG